MIGWQTSKELSLVYVPSNLTSETVHCADVFFCVCSIWCVSPHIITWHYLLMAEHCVRCDIHIASVSINKWSDANYSDVEWTVVICGKWFCFEVKWRESEPYTDGTWCMYLDYIIRCESCSVVVLLLCCVGACMSGCFDNCVVVLVICLLVFTVFCIVFIVFLYCLYCVLYCC
jgi:hypothetical protein